MNSCNQQFKWQTRHATSNDEERRAAAKRAALRPPTNWKGAALAFKRASAHKSICRKIRPRTATETNRRMSGPRMVLTLYHINDIQAAGV